MAANVNQGMSATTKTRILNAIRDVPLDMRYAVLSLTAQVLLEQVRRAPVDINDADEALKVIATFVPDATLAEPLPQTVRNVLAETMGALIPAAAGVQGERRQRGDTITVETTEAREAREKTITVAGIKMPKNPEAPYSAFYPHMWLPPTVADPATAPETWHRLMNDFFRDLKVPDHMLFKKKLYYEQIDLWFLIVKEPRVTVDTVSAPLVKLFLNTIKLILEMFLVSGCTLSGTPTAATQMFAHLVEERKHEGKALDFFADLQKARAAPKEGVTKPLFR